MKAWDNLTVYDVKVYRQACADLLAYYKGEARRELVEEISVVCPLCRIGAYTQKHCATCPWEVFGHGYCLTWIDNTLGKGADFDAQCREKLAPLRIPMLEDWITKTDEYLAKRGE